MKKTYAEKIYKRSKLILLIGLLISIGVFIASSYFTFKRIGSFNYSNPLVVTISVTLFALLMILVHEISRYLDRKIDKVGDDAERSRRGFEGENLAKPIILDAIDLEDKVFFNKDLPTGGDIDCLIVGKRGVILLEIKNYQKHIFLPSGFTKGFRDPRWEARKHALKLNAYFKERGLNKKINFHMAVLYINPDVRFSGKQNGVYNICGLEKFKQYFDELRVNDTIIAEDIQKIISLIDSLK